MIYIKKIKNFLLVFSLTLVFALSFSSSAQATSVLSCSLTTAASCTGTVVLRLSGSVNAHAELPSQATANYDANVICCTGVTGLGNSCSGNYANVLKLSKVTNAHVEQNTQANYTNAACLSVTNGTVTIAYQANNCTGYDTTIASMKYVTNSHVGGPNAYSEYEICGKVAVPPVLTSYTNNTDATLNSTNCATTGCGARIGGGAGFRHSITITGTDFGADPGAGNRSSATYNIKVGTHQIASANVTAWSDTSITFLTDSNTTGDTDADWGTNFGGTSALTVTSNSLVSSGINFYVFPQVTSITVPTAVANAAREYNAADTDGVITLNGTRFGTAVTGGWVRILGCDSTTCSSPSGSVVTNSWSNTAIAVQVPAVIANNVYTGSIIMQQGTGTSNKGYTYTTSGFRILPRVASFSPTSAGAGVAVTVNGDHFCQNNAVCPTAFDTNNNVTFQSAADATVFTSWGDSSIVTAVPSAAVSGTVLVTSNTYDSNNNVSFTVLSPIPNDPTSLSQFNNVNLSSAVSVGAISSSTSIYLTEIMQAALSGGTLYPQIEYEPVGTAFSCTGTGTCAQAIEGTGKAGPGPIDCSVLANGCSIAITPSSDGIYHWQARVRHNKGGINYYSNWVSYGANSESGTDFQIDTTGPVITFAGANTCATALSSVSTNGSTIAWTVNELATGQLTYSKNSDLSSAINTSIDASAFTHSFTLSNLDSNTTYYFRAKSIDSVGNSTSRPTVSPYCSFTTGGVTQPAKTTKFYIGGVPGTLTGGTATTSAFSVYVPENSVSVISAFVELNGFSPSSGTNNITISANGTATSTYSIASNANSFKVLYPISGSNLNFDPITNSLTINPSLNLNISSAELVLTYSYAP